VIDYALYPSNISFVKAPAHWLLDHLPEPITLLSCEVARLRQGPLSISHVRKLHFINLSSGPFIKGKAFPPSFLDAFSILPPCLSIGMVGKCSRLQAVGVFFILAWAKSGAGA
jgi:hypothetical protein